MKRWVVDASVAAKWYLPPADEPLAEQAQAFLAHTNTANLIVPDLFFAEFASVFRKAERRGRCDRATADLAVTSLLARELPAARLSKLAAPALALARQYGITVYDAIYVALAIFADAVLVTADESLFRLTADRAPVEWLGAWS